MRFRKSLIALAVAPVLALGLASPASAHENTCSHSEHYLGHNNVYAMYYRYAFTDYYGAHWHHYDRMSHRNFWGDYTHYDYSVDVRC